MKKWVLFFYLLNAGIYTYACDICGAGPGNTYMGLLPEFNNRFVGMRYQQSGVRYHLGPGGTATYLTTAEQFYVTELWGATNIGKRFRVAVFMPYTFIKRSNQQENSNTNGLGDITTIGYYRLMDKQGGRSAGSVAQSLWLGGGVKLPTGKYNPEEKNIGQSSLNTFQLGTGSIDFSLNAMYDIRWGKMGINTNAAYKMNTQNRFDYRYGNKLTVNMLGYYRVSLTDKITLIPNTGILWEGAAKDWKTPDIQVWETGGRSLMGTVGAEMSIGKISLGANSQMPLVQTLGEGKVSANNRWMAHISIAF